MDIIVRSCRESEHGGCRGSSKPEFKFMVRVGLEGLDSEATIYHYTFWEETQSFLMNPRKSFFILSQRLSDLDIPRSEHSRIIRKVWHFAEQLATSPENAGRRISPIFLGLIVKHEVAELQQSEAAVKDAEEEEEEEEEAEEERGECAIRLEAISGCGRWLPCSHEYHEDCIANWLQRRNVCPLSRSQVDDS